LDAARTELRQTDEAWAAAASEGKDAEKIVSFWADDAKVYPPGAPVIEGKAAIREFINGALSAPGFSANWDVHEVVVSPDGKMGYTLGVDQFTEADSTGALLTMKGRYVTFWRKESSGNWKCVIDIWNEGMTE